MQPLHSPEQSATIDVSASTPLADRQSEPASQQSPLQAAAAPVDERVAEAGPVLSLVNPRRGPTSGGDEILLIVSNLPPMVKLYARFGCNIAAAVSGMIHLGLVNKIYCANGSLLGSYFTRGTFLSSPPRSPSWSGQCHTMSSTFYKC